MTTLTSDVRERIIKKYPKVNFQFCENAEKAMPFIGDAEVLLTFGTDVTANIIRQAQNLKWIMVLSAGVEELPYEEIKKRNILVTNVKGIHKVPMAEYAIAMFLQVYQQTQRLAKHQQDQIWDQSIPIREITGRTMTVFGTGAIGQEVARLAKAFNIKTIGVSFRGKEKEYFDEVYSVKEMEKSLPEADFIVAVLPSTAQTVHLFKDVHFQMMKESAIFLNMGRGDVVASETIIHAVDRGEIDYAVLDVFEEEPLPKSHPLWNNDKVIITPHTSGKFSSYIPMAAEIFETNLTYYLSNNHEKMINMIDVNRRY